MNKYFRIANKNILVSSPHFPETGDCLYLFETDDDKPDMELYCRTEEELYEPVQVRGHNVREFFVHVDGSTVKRVSYTDLVPAAVSVFDKNTPNVSHTSFTTESIAPAMRGGNLFFKTSAVQLFLRKGTLFLHASFVEYNGRAVLFAAPSGTGKSTQASLWEKYLGADIINGDKAAVNVENGAAFAHGVPFSGTSGICKNRSLPLAAIVLLKQSEKNTVEQLKGAGAAAGLLHNVYLDLSDPEERTLAMLCAADILSDVPVYSFGCTKEKDAAFTLFDYLCKSGDITAYGL